MGLKNLFNRKPKNTGKDTTTTVTPPPELVSRVQLEQVFNKFDVNGDGQISSSELGLIMGSLGHRLTETELNNMMTEVNGNGDGFIDLKQFIELNTNGVDSVELLENLKDAFDVFDVDKNGLITAEELKNVLGSLGEECSVGR